MIRLEDKDFHHHIKARMNQRGITKEEVELTINEGYDADDAKEGIYGKMLIFPYNDRWEGRFFEEKEVRVYYRLENDNFILLTVKARYGSEFQRRHNEDRI
ncbi:MAG: DUF4258 domain-containing protein [bacterium]